MASVSGTSITGTNGNNFRLEVPNSSSDFQSSLFNLSQLHQKMDSLQQFLSESIDRNTLLGKDQMDLVSNEISSAIHQIIVNGAALISSTQSHQNLVSEEGTVLMSGNFVDRTDFNSPTSLNALLRSQIAGKAVESIDLTVQMSYPRSSVSEDLIGSETNNQLDFSLSSEKLKGRTDPTDSNSLMRTQIAMNAPVTVFSSITAEAVKPVDLSTVQMRFPAVEGSNTSAVLRGFGMNNPDFNLSFEKMKGKIDPKVEQMKDEIDDGDCEIVELDAVELLAEHIHFCEICGKGFKRDANLRMHMRAHGNQFKTPEALAKPDKGIESRHKVRFSCPFVGCNRNKSHKKFRPLKSAVCVKSHFRRSHCPKMYSCNRCNKKSFSILADLKGHLKHCGESKWRCSCGTTFSRKDKLFGHMALFEGHMPAIAEEGERSKGPIAMEEDEETQLEDESVPDGFDQGLFFDSLQENFSSIDDGDSLKDVFGSPILGTGLEGWFDM
ncbi:zinc finger protein [Macleaya cordata]|uniref:Zinc finger protein n=1 Tax=Macleaya cordata TaxID=56857 RepID=A0A200PMB2_MACCD|nr:zinc finger protein [Macleaya cordata]